MPDIYPVTKETLSKYLTKIPDILTTSGHLLLVSIPGRKNKLVMFECLLPYEKVESFLEGYYFRFPMFFVAMGLVLFY